ncbi:MAG TPA: biotin transporter BioY [Firmicutes bacterium]|nr:biotin transporter BioY [Bacillota bacterium]
MADIDTDKKAADISPSPSLPSSSPSSGETAAILHSTRLMVRSAFFAALTAVGAVLTLPLPVSPVPFTLQVMFMIMSGLVLGARYGAYSQLIYVLMGAVGLPVFAKGGAGLGILLGPTGGFIVGFIASAWVIGLLAQLIRKLSFSRRLRLVFYMLAALAGSSIYFLLGTWRLAAVLQIGWREAALLGILPFIIPDAVKAIAAAWLTVALEERGILSADLPE